MDIKSMMGGDSTHFLKRGAGDLIFTTCDCYGLNNVVFNFEAHT